MTRAYFSQVSVLEVAQSQGNLQYNKEGDAWRTFEGV